MTSHFDCIVFNDRFDGDTAWRRLLWRHRIDALTNDGAWCHEACDMDYALSGSKSTLPTASSHFHTPVTSVCLRVFERVISERHMLGVPSFLQLKLIAFYTFARRHKLSQLSTALLVDRLTYIRQLPVQVYTLGFQPIHAACYRQHF